MQLPTQEQFVKDCLAKYWFTDIPSDQKWEAAHFPTPECLGGEDTVMLWSADHTVLGLLQSVKFDHKCFHHSANKKDLCNLETYYPEYLELFAQLKSQFSKKQVKKSNATNKANGTGFYDPKIQSANGKKGGEIGAATNKANSTGIYNPNHKAQKTGGRRCVELGVGAHDPCVRSAAGKKGSSTTNSQLWQSTHPGFEKHVSNSGGLSTWQKARGIDTSLRLRRFDLEQFNISQNIPVDTRPPF